MFCYIYVVLPAIALLLQQDLYSLNIGFLEKSEETVI